MGTFRRIESVEEAVRRDFAKDLYTNVRLLDNRILLRNVDADAINKCRLSQYGQMKHSIRRMDMFSEEQADVDKARDYLDGERKGNFAGRVDARSFDLDESVQKIYFDYYGESASGEPVMDRIGAPYVCPCGQKMMMEWKLLPDECPACHRLTPIGKLMRDGVMHR